MRLLESARGETRVQLAGNTRAALDQYSDKLANEKLRALESAICRRLRELCRKPGFAESVTIDRTDFQLALLRQGRLFLHRELSAGEKQLVAIAVLWALRDVSELPIPVFIDTPVAYLDTDHTRNVVEHFLPHISHQTVLFAIDTELSATRATGLEPILARTYDLQHDDLTGSTRALEHQCTPVASEEPVLCV